MQEVGKKFHNNVLNSKVKSNQTNEAQSAKALILANQHIVQSSNPYK